MRLQTRWNAFAFLMLLSGSKICRPENVSAPSLPYFFPELPLRPSLKTACKCTGNNSAISLSDKELILPVAWEFYGTYCASWNSLSPVCLPGGDYQGTNICTSSWCYVPEECPTATKSKLWENLWWDHITACAVEYEHLCGEEILDLDTTCSTSHRLWGGPVTTLGEQDEINDSPALCCQYCKRFPNATHTDYWSRLHEGWCNCYDSCEIKRCVSVDCFGSEGGNTFTQVMRVLAPPSPPSPISPLAPPLLPSQPSFPPPLPPAPPLATTPAGDGSGGLALTVAEALPAHALENLRTALGDQAVNQIWLHVDIVLSVATAALPAVNHTLAITGRCQDNARDGLCEISGSQEVELLAVTSRGHLELQGIALRHAHSSGRGPALHLAAGGTAVLRGCAVEGNKAASHGGACYCGYGSSLTVDDSRVAENYAGEDGGAIYGNQFVNLTLLGSSTLEMNNCLSRGGAVFVHKHGSITVEGNVSFTHNFAMAHGGAIYAYYSSTLLVRDSVMANNTAEMRGGAVACDSLCTISLGGRSALEDNNSGESGGALYSHGKSSVTVGPDTVLRGNRVWGDRHGGGVYLYENSKLQVDGIISGNSVGGDGGGVSVGILSQVVVSSSGRVEHNRALQNGGGIHTRESCTVVVMPGGAVRWNSGANGGGLCSLGTVGYTNVVRLEGCSVLGNAAAGAGGGVYGMMSHVMVIGGPVVEGNKCALDGGGVAVIGGSITVTDAEVRGNVAGVGGGGLSGGGGTQVTAANHSKVHTNVALGTGGGFLVSGTSSNLTMRNSSCDANRAVYGGCVALLLAARGIIADGSQVIENEAGADGGGLHLTDGAWLGTEGGARISNNRAGDSGGGVSLDYSNGSFTESVLEMNVGNLSGGAIHLNKGAQRFDRGAAQFDGDQMPGLGVWGVYLYTSKLEMRAGTLVAGNDAARSGGGIAGEKDSSVILSGGTIHQNAASSGGGIYLVSSNLGISGGALLSLNVAQRDGGQLMLVTSTFDGSGCSLIRAVARGQGGQVYLMRGSEGALRDSEVLHGQAGLGGGGLVVDEGSKLTLTRVLVSRNFATGSNGGGLLMQESGVLHATNCSFVENHALEGHGGAIMLSLNTAVSINGSRFDGNEADRGAAVATEPTIAQLAVSLTAFTGNRAVYGAALYIDPPVANVSLNTSLNASAVTNEEPGAASQASDEQRKFYFYQLELSNNSASVGSHLFWEYKTSAYEPECVDCWHKPNDTALLATSSVQYAIVQGDAVVDGAVLQTVSGMTLSPTLSYRAFGTRPSPPLARNPRPPRSLVPMIHARGPAC
ncbi:hypothetical protein CYMTET_52617 [Cymbomonas tetramitiformis]|uniref:Right handed beta helix domain-containing protein n=1 Tax=Cymbomonas tetramitiformis TaxID=36881 RepID=A0AAE0BJT0_9CHLO|nr:hypothetical protein CYMTET_52617 [Cymbomonas tetramitiformis]